MNEAKKPSVHVYVPARLGSTRLKKKALMPMCGVPMVLHSLNMLRDAQSLSNGYLNLHYSLNSEADEILSVARTDCHPTYKRDSSLAQDSTTTEEILADFLKSLPDTADYVMVVNPTSPLFTAHTLLDFIRGMIETRTDTQFSASQVHKHAWFRNKPFNYSFDGPHPRTQDLEPVLFINWAVFAWDARKARASIRGKGDCLYIGKVSPFCIPDAEAFDVDTLEDFHAADLAMKASK
jgi:N-acylneuraminate cytidylyltransferase